MSTKLKFLCLYSMVFGLCLPGFSQDTTFTYKGRLKDGGNPGTSSDDHTIKIGQQGTQTITVIAGIYGTSISGGNHIYVNSSGHLGTVNPAFVHIVTSGNIMNIPGSRNGNHLYIQADGRWPTQSVRECGRPLPLFSGSCQNLHPARKRHKAGGSPKVGGTSQGPWRNCSQLHLSIISCHAQYHSITFV